MNADTNAKLAADVQAYAARVGAVDLMEDLTKVLICERPAEPLTHLAAHLEMGATVTLPSEAGACGTEADASEYLEAHKLPQTLEELMGMLLFSRPDDARAFLAAELRKIAAGSADAGAAASESKRDGFFTDDDLSGMFSLFDPTGKGYLSSDQASAGAKSLGLPGTDVPAGSAADGGLTADEFAAWTRSLLDEHRII